MKFSALLNRLKRALREDAAFSDVTTRSIPGARKNHARAIILAKENGVYCGAFLLKPLFHTLDRKIKVHFKARDGQKVKKGQVLAKLKGPAQALLAGERVFLNLACHLSGVATRTRLFVDAVKNTKAQILDTRKTTPLWRDLERFAVECGGGVNHRFSLRDAILIKDNHLQLIRSGHRSPRKVYGPVSAKLKRKKKIKFVELEAKTYKDVWDGIKMRADVIMLDNMSKEQIKKSIHFIEAARKALNLPTPLIEVSGGMTLKKVRSLSKMKVDRISIGSLTHSAPALDISMEVF